MLLDAAKVTTQIASCYLEPMHGSPTGGIALAKGKLKRLIGKSTGGG
jgi:hypothetical protein